MSQPAVLHFTYDAIYRRYLIQLVSNDCIEPETNSSPAGPIVTIICEVSINRNGTLRKSLQSSAFMYRLGYLFDALTYQSVSSSRLSHPACRRPSRWPAQCILLNSSTRSLMSSTLGPKPSHTSSCFPSSKSRNLSTISPSTNRSGSSPSRVPLRNARHTLKLMLPGALT